MTVLAIGGAAPDALIARLDPRTRVVAALAFSLVLVATDGIAAPAAGLVAALGLAGLARLAPRLVLRRLLGLEGFMVAVLVMLPFTVPGSPAFEVLGLTASAEGLRRALAIALKANAVVLAVLALLGSMEAVTLGQALGRLGLPDRFVTLFLFTIRYIDVLYSQYGRLRLAMRARAFRPRAGLHTWRSVGWLFGMLLVTSVERSERIHAAMRLRGFSGRFPRLDEAPAGMLDWGFGAAKAALLVMMVVVDVL
jgi:cobalt/nickel transport system permease protein